MTQATTPRWYCVDKQGGAVLCTGQHNAKDLGEELDQAEPELAPHRAVQMVEYVESAQPTVPTNSQEWAGMDGAIAYHLIERHADNWADVGKMMGEWLAANQQAAQPTTEPDALHIAAVELARQQHARIAELEAALEARQEPAQETAVWTDEQLQMLNFLYGAGEWDGLFFDEKHPTKKGAFWWRSDLRRLFTTPPAQPAPAVPVDEEGENQAVRCFLMLYGQAGVTVGHMKKHMAMSGFRSWPTWVETENDGAHLTKAGAQLWIRHLFSLEAAHGITGPAETKPAGQEWVSLTDEINAWYKILPNSRAVGQWESSRQADYARGWNDFRKEMKAAIEAKLREKNAGARPAAVQDGWQPIETAPKDGSLILLGRAEDLVNEESAASTVGRWFDGEEDGQDYLGHDGGFMDVGFQEFKFPRSFGAEKYRTEGIQPTHWMPLPAAPKEGGAA